MGAARLMLLLFEACEARRKGAMSHHSWVRGRCRGRLWWRSGSLAWRGDEKMLYLLQWRYSC